MTEAEKMEFALMLDLRAMDLTEVWRLGYVGTFEQFLKRVIKVSPARYRRWVETYASDALVSPALMDRVEQLNREMQNKPADDPKEPA